MRTIVILMIRNVASLWVDLENGRGPVHMSSLASMQVCLCIRVCNTYGCVYYIQSHIDVHKHTHENTYKGLHRSTGYLQRKRRQLMTSEKIGSESFRTRLSPGVTKLERSCFLSPGGGTCWGKGSAKASGWGLRGQRVDFQKKFWADKEECTERVNALKDSDFTNGRTLFFLFCFGGFVVVTIVFILFFVVVLRGGMLRSRCSISCGGAGIVWTKNV